MGYRGEGNFTGRKLRQLAEGVPSSLWLSSDVNMYERKLPMNSQSTHRTRTSLCVTRQDKGHQIDYSEEWHLSSGIKHISERKLAESTLKKLDNNLLQLQCPMWYILGICSYFKFF
jgi:hypothetical protein